MYCSLVNSVGTRNTTIDSCIVWHTVNYFLDFYLDIVWTKQDIEDIEKFHQNDIDTSPRLRPVPLFHVFIFFFYLLTECRKNVATTHTLVPYPNLQ